MLERQYLGLSAFISQIDVLFKVLGDQLVLGRRCPDEQPIEPRIGGDVHVLGARAARIRCPRRRSRGLTRSTRRCGLGRASNRQAAPPHRRQHGFEQSRGILRPGVLEHVDPHFAPIATAHHVGVHDVVELLVHVVGEALEFDAIAVRDDRRPGGVQRDEVHGPLGQHAGGLLLGLVTHRDQLPGRQVRRPVRLQRAEHPRRRNVPVPLGQPPDLQIGVALQHPVVQVHDQQVKGQQGLVVIHQPGRLEGHRLGGLEVHQVEALHAQAAHRGQVGEHALDRGVLPGEEIGPFLGGQDPPLGIGLEIRQAGPRIPGGGVRRRVRAVVDGRHHRRRRLCARGRSRGSVRRPRSRTTGSHRRRRRGCGRSVRRGHIRHRFRHVNHRRLNIRLRWRFGYRRSAAYGVRPTGVPLDVARRLPDFTIRLGAHRWPPARTIRGL